MLSPIQPTAWDLRFRVWGLPVRVHPMFWLVSAALGWRGAAYQWTLLWIGCVFLSILVHELGHALMMRRFGHRPEIVLWAWGGYAMYIPAWREPTRRAVAILLAGPGAGFVLWGLLQGLKELFRRQILPWPEDPRLQLYLLGALHDLEYINLWWGLVNLLPVQPLDGGQISRHLFAHVSPGRGIEFATQLSFAVAVGIAVAFYRFGNQFAAIMFAFLAFQNFQELQRTRW